MKVIAIAICLQLGLGLVAATDRTLLSGNSKEPRLTLQCRAGEEAALFHLAIATLPRPLERDVVQGLRDESKALFREVKRKADLVHAGSTTVDDARLVERAEHEVLWGTFLQLQRHGHRHKGPVGGLEMFWLSRSHQKLADKLAKAAIIDDDGRLTSAAVFEACVCDDHTMKCTGNYHFGVVVDVKDDRRDDSCADTVLQELAKWYRERRAHNGASDDGMVCGKHSKLWDGMSFADDANKLVRNWKRAKNDVGCLFNYTSRRHRNRALKAFLRKFDNDDGPLRECASRLWAVGMEN